MACVVIRSLRQCIRRMSLRHSSRTTPLSWQAYSQAMNRDEHLERHLKLCQAMYERMKREGSWPWPDSLDSEDVIESENNTNIA